MSIIMNALLLLRSLTCVYISRIKTYLTTNVNTHLSMGHQYKLFRIAFVSYNPPLRQCVAYHIKGPVFIDDDSLSDGSTVDIDDPEQRRRTRSSSHLARQTYVLVADIRRRRPTTNYRTVYRSVIVDSVITRCSSIEEKHLISFKN